MIDNIQVAILTRVNQLAERFGIKPYHFVAVIKSTHDTSMSLTFEVPVSVTNAKTAEFNKMLDLIGIERNTHELKGTDAEIVDALDSALRLAPRKRSPS